MESGRILSVVEKNRENIVGSNLNVNDCCEGSGRSQVLVTETGRKAVLFTEWQISSVKLYAVVIWKAEFVSDKPGYLAEKIFKQSVEGAASLFVDI